MEDQCVKEPQPLDRANSMEGLPVTNSKHPRNWSPWHKGSLAGVLIFLEFFTTMISTTGPSAAADAQGGPGYGFDLEILLVAFSFMYQIGQAIGGLIVPPFSEDMGRKMPYLISTAVFLIGCVLTAAIPSIGGAISGRFLQGLASAAPSVVVGGSIEDMYDEKSRVWLVFAWAGGSTIALAIGPIYGAWIAASAGWQWIYYIAAITTANILVLVAFSPETEAKTIKSKQNESTSRPPRESWSFEDTVLRPSRFLFTEPILLVVTLQIAYAWGIIFLLTEALTIPYEAFGFSTTVSSLAFAPIGVGAVFGVGPRLWDLRVQRKRKAQGKAVEPEDKLGGFVLAAPALAVGLWWWSWTIPPSVSNVHWIVSMLALGLVGFAANDITYTLEGYIVEAYTTHASSALAGLSFVRAIVAGAMPLFASQMFHGLGSNVAGSILAALATSFCIFPPIFIKYGKAARIRSKYARLSVKE